VALWLQANSLVNLSLLSDKKDIHAYIYIATCTGVFWRLVALRANIRSINCDYLSLIKN